MKRGYVRLLGVVLTLGLLAGAAAAKDELVVMDLPAKGPLGPVAFSLAAALKQAEYDVRWRGQFEARQGGRSATALVATADAPLIADLRSGLPLLVDRGAGLVLLVSPTAEGIAHARALLEPFGVAVFGVKHGASGVAPAAHPLTAGLDEMECPALEFGLSGQGLSVLLAQGGVPVAMGGAVGRGRLVVLPDRLLQARADGAVAPAAAQLLRQATLWAASGATSGNNPIRWPSFDPPDTPGGATPPSTPGQPGTQLPPLQLPPSRFEEFKARAIVDLGATEPDWVTIRKVLLEELEAAGLPAEVLRAPTGKTPSLLPSLEARPGLLVLTPYRAFSEEEVAAVGMHVRAGASVLALGWANAITVQRLINLNGLLAELGVAISYGRPAGVALVKSHPATRNLRQLGAAPAGVSCWAFGDFPLATVGGRPVATALQVGQGRVIAMDAGMLVPPARPPAGEDPAVSYRRLLAGALRWLMGQEK